MKKKFKIYVDCAACAQKMEDAAKKVTGVKEVKITFMTQKMTVEADDDMFDDVLDNIIKACKKVEPDCEFYI
ncbi:cation transporter [Eggerthia catenaformis]|uniref:cation transporter n=1 Tax=Eggerthia catenaformis TaxID=31973 RepID=UPI00248D7878|nr:cation transporter [Eggerthia catenaformis]